MTGRLLLMPGSDATARAAVDWAVAHLAGCRVVACGRPAGARPIGRLEHPPFAPAVGETAALAAQVAALLLAPPEAGATGTAALPAKAGVPARAAEDLTDDAAPILEAAALAVLDGSPLLVCGTAPFRTLVRLSAWSMNVPSRQDDATLGRHAAIAARAPGALLTALASATPPAAGPGLAEAFERRDRRALTAAARTRRLAARADGPVRFRRVAAKSAGLRPFALYLDLVPALAQRPEAAARLLGAAGPEKAVALLGMSIALFL